MSDGKKRFKLFSELEATSTKDWLVDKFLGAGEQSAQYGRPGDGKSVWLRTWGCMSHRECLAQGWPVRRGLMSSSPWSEANLSRAAQCVRKKHGVSDLPFAIVSGVWDFRDRRTITQTLEIIREIEAATGERIVLVIIDTLREPCAWDENGKDMVLSSALLAGYSKRLAPTLCWSTTFPRTVEHLRGHGSLLGAMDTTIYVEKRGNIRTATIIKANDAEEGEQITFTLESVPIGAETNAPVVLPAENAMRAKSVEPEPHKKSADAVFVVVWGRGGRPDHRTVE